MSNKDIHPILYDEFMGIFKTFIDLFKVLYRLQANNEEEINAIYKNIKENLIDSMKYSPRELIDDLSNMAQYNSRYMKSYFELAKLIYEDYKPIGINRISDFFECLSNKVNGIVSSGSEIYSLAVQKENEIFKAIMDDDNLSFIFFTESNDFDENQTLQSSLFPLDSDTGYSLLELCCYYGAVNCFKILITKFNPDITLNCLRFSFLSGNPDIMNECLKYQKPDKICMEYAIISHNIDFVTFLMNKYDIKINLLQCCKYSNLEAFFVYLDQTDEINECFIYSPILNIPSLCEYLISHGAQINTKDDFGKSALHISALNNRKEIGEFLISHGADINSKDNDEWTPLHYAIQNNSQDFVELLISHCADVNAKNENEITPLHQAAYFNYIEILEILISHGADINAKDCSGRNALHFAAYNNREESLKALISHNADLQAVTNNGDTYLNYLHNDYVDEDDFECIFQIES